MTYDSRLVTVVTIPAFTRLWPDYWDEDVDPRTLSRIRGAIDGEDD